MSLAGVTLAMLGCSTPAQRGAATSEQPGESATAAPPSAHRDAPRSSLRAAQNGGAEPPDVPAATAPSGATTGPRLLLPVDPEFLQQRLPPPVSDRYASWRETSRLDVGLGYLTEVDRLPSGRWLTLSQDDGKVRVYDRTSRRLVAQHPVPGFQQFDHVALVAWPSGADSFLRGATDGLHVHDAASGAELQLVDERPTWQLRWSADRRVLMAVGPGSTEHTSVLRFYERREARLVALGEQAFAERVDAWDLSPDGRLLAVALFPSDTLHVFDLRGGRELHVRAAPRYAGDVAFSPDGRFLAAAGDGLLVVDLVNPERIGFYSHVKNNMGYVRFSPSGDAVVASSYDGKIRILSVGVTAEGRLELALMRELSHSGQANVYGFVFSADGQELLSASGDRTLRAFGGQQGARSPTDGTAVFHDLDTWRKLEPAAALPLAKPRSTEADGRLILPSEREPARPSRIAPGRYACKITLIYKLRPCWVHQDPEGRTLLEFSPDNLLHLGGVLWDDGGVVRFEAKLLTPSSVVGCADCDKQPLHAVFRGQGGKYTGVLTFRQYYDPFVPPLPPPPNVRHEEANDRYPLVLEWVGPFDASVE